MSSPHDPTALDEARVHALALDLHERHQQTEAGRLDRAMGLLLALSLLLVGAAALLWGRGDLIFRAVALGGAALLVAPSLALATGYPGHRATPWAVGLGIAGVIWAAHYSFTLQLSWLLGISSAALALLAIYWRPGPPLLLGAALAAGLGAMPLTRGESLTWRLQALPELALLLPALLASALAWRGDMVERLGARRLARERVQQDTARSFFEAQGVERSGVAQVSDLSHALHPPMNAILDYTEQLDQEGLPEEVRQQHLRAIRRHGHNLMHLLNDMVDLSELDNQEEPPELQPVSPMETAQAAASALASQAQEKGLDFEVEFRSALPESFPSDGQRLQQILNHLLGHAIKFTHEGRVDLQVSYQAEDNNPQITFEVTDTGIGISPLALDRLQRGQARPEDAGVSLDLIISQRLTHHLGGQLQIESDLGRGTRATLRFSAGEAPARLIPPPGSVTLDTQAVPPPRPPSPLRVLLGEPSRDHQLLISAHLRHEGAHVTMVDNGQHVLEETLAALDRGEPYDVLLLNMSMPEMDGYETTARLRHKGYKRPIFALTRSDRDRARCLAAGCDEHLLRPAERERLLEAIQQHTQRKMHSLQAQHSQLEPEEEVAAQEAPWEQPAPEVAQEQPLPPHQHQPELLPEPPTQEMIAFAPEGAVCSQWALDLEMQPLLREFVRQLPEMLAPIEQGVQRKDHEKVRAAAHRLKGSAGAYGFQTLAQSADTLVRGGQDLLPWEQLQFALAELKEQSHRATAAPAPLEQA